MIITAENPVRPPSEYRSSNSNPINVPVCSGRILTDAEIRQNGHYNDMADLAKIFNHDIIAVVGGGSEVWRWRPNLFIDWLTCHAPCYCPSSADSIADGKAPYSYNCDTFRVSMDLKRLTKDLHNGMFTIEEWMKFHMQMGYSLCGYADIFGRREAYDYGVPGAKVPLHDDRCTETLIDYMLRIHAGRVLRI